MGWERTKATTTELPAEPSFVGWLMAGGVAAIIGVLLFILHASGMVKALTSFNIWWLAGSPLIVWLFFFCLRGWLWGRTVDEHQFLQKEAEHGQVQWEAWAGRHLAVLGSSILLPSGVKSDAIAESKAAGAFQYLSLSCHFESGLFCENRLLELGLAGVQIAIKALPSSLPLNVTIMTDSTIDDLDVQFRKCWGELYPERDVPASVSVCETFPFSWVEERIKQPILDVDLVLMLQTKGQDSYSDALAALLLTSDDVALKYQLPHTARILRPMQLDMAHFKFDMELFLGTQTDACRTSKVFCDTQHWSGQFADVMTAARLKNTSWLPEAIDILEKYNGIPGAGSAWLLATLLSDIVYLSKTPHLGLFTSGAEYFISTITPGSENHDAG